MIGKVLIGALAVGAVGFAVVQSMENQELENRLDDTLKRLKGYKGQNEDVQDAVADLEDLKLKMQSDELLKNTQAFVGEVKARLDEIVAAFEQYSSIASKA